MNWKRREAARPETLKRDVPVLFIDRSHLEFGWDNKNVIATSQEVLPHESL